MKELGQKLTPMTRRDEFWMKFEVFFWLGVSAGRSAGGTGDTWIDKIVILRVLKSNIFGFGVSV